jgi:hypothetical protein
MGKKLLKPKKSKSMWTYQLQKLKRGRGCDFSNQSYCHSDWKSHFEKIEKLGGTVSLASNTEIEIYMPEDDRDLLFYLLTSKIRCTSARWSPSHRSLTIEYGMVL